MAEVLRGYCRIDTAEFDWCKSWGICYTALAALFDLIHLVQRYFFTLRPFSVTLIFWIFGFQIFWDFLFEWLTLCPNWTALPQISHFAILLSRVIKKINEWKAISIIYSNIATILWLFYIFLEIFYKVAVYQEYL